MRTILRGLAFMVFAVATLTAFGQSAGTAHKALTAESQRLRPWAMDPLLLDAVKAQNRRRVAMAEIRKIDQQWQAGAIRKDVMSGQCADRLRQLAKLRNYYVEIFVTDNQGALVCANVVTSDYWQGDEAKWTKAFNNGRGAEFVDRIRYDESAKATLGGISLPMFDGKNAIGVLTVGVKTEKLPPAR